MSKEGYLEKHSRIYTFLIFIVSILIALILGEMAIRFFVNYNPGYYMHISKTSDKISFPYGDIIFNEDGFADSEFFKVKSKDRVGYFGDSICYGIGAGYGFRVSEILEKRMVDYEHMNFCRAGVKGASSDHLDKVVKIASDYQLDHILLFFNLNDITPEGEAEEQNKLKKTYEKLSSTLDWLRGNSYLYTLVRSKIKIIIQGYGYTNDGFIAYEFYPLDNEEIIRTNVSNIIKTKEKLNLIGKELCVVVLPYEMQISEIAANEYRNKGISWQEGFTQRSPQNLIKKYVNNDVMLIDAYDAFINEQNARDRKNIRPGEYYVNTMGDSLDWNHLNKNGHSKLAGYLENILAAEFR